VTLKPGLVVTQDHRKLYHSIRNSLKPLIVSLGRLDVNASEEVLFALIKSKCLPVLFYGIEACPINSTV